MNYLYKIKRIFLAHDHIIILFIALGISFFLYGNTLGGQFVFDDTAFVLRRELRDPAYGINLWLDPTYTTWIAFRPLVLFSWWLLFQLFGEAPFYFHLVNLLLNGLNTFLVYLVVRKLSRSQKAAFISAALFAVLPIHTESIALIKSRDELMMTAFGLFSFICFATCMEVKRGLRYECIRVGSYLAFFLGLLSKEWVIVLPVFFFIWATRFSRQSVRYVLKEMVPFAGIIAVYVLWRYLIAVGHTYNPVSVDFVFNPLNKAPWDIRVWTNIQMIAMYIIKTFIPYNLSAGYQYNHIPLVSNPIASPMTVMGIVFILSMAVVLMKRSMRQSPMVAGLFFFLTTFILVPRIIIHDVDIFAERWMYLPSVGLVVIASYGLLWISKRTRLHILVILVPLLMIYGFRTIDRNRVWLTQESFLESFVRDAPNNAFAQYSMAKFKLESGDIAGARLFGDKSYAIYPKGDRLKTLLGRIFLTEGNYQEAARLLEGVPGLPAIRLVEHSDYAYLLFRLGKTQECATYIYDRYGDSPPIYKLRFVYGICLLATGQNDKAERYIVWDDKTSQFVPRKTDDVILQ